MVEQELTTVNPDVRAQINALSAEVRNVPRETPAENPAQPETPRPVTKEQAPSKPAQAETAEADDNGDSDVSPKRKGRAQERIQELVAEKNRMKEELEKFNQYTPLISEYQKALQEQQKPVFQEFNTQEELFNAAVAKAKEDAKKEILGEFQKEFAPIKQERANNQYLQHVNSWFDQNPDAQKAKAAMNEFSATLSDEERGFYESQILKGNTRPLELIYRAVAPQVVPVDNATVVQNAIRSDQQRVGVGSSVKATRAVEGISSVEEDMGYASKKQDFSAFIKKHLL